MRIAIKVFFIFFISIISIQTYAQKKKVPNLVTHDDRAIHFGFCVGINQMNFVLKQDLAGFANDSLSPEVSNPSLGFHIQIISNYRLAEYLDMRFLPGVSFGERLVYFYKNNKLENKDHELNSYNIELPLLLKYKAKRLNNFRPYLIGGTNIRIALNNSYNVDPVFISTKKLSYNYEIGSGIDFYLNYFKMSVELKLTQSLNNVLVKRPYEIENIKYQNSIEALYPTIWMFSLHFE